MARSPLPLGTWGKVTFTARRTKSNGRPAAYRARAAYRGYDGVTRYVEAEARTKTLAEQALMARLRQVSAPRHGGMLSANDRFSMAAELWFTRVRQQVEDGRRSQGTLQTYRGQLERHVLPALGQVRLREISTPLLDRVLRAIKEDVSTATARTCRSVISGILGVAVRHGAIATNPIRDIERLEGRSNRLPRALDADEIQQWFAMLEADPKARAADLPDLTAFMLATGARIGETLGLVWGDVDLAVGEVAITQQLIRITGVGLVRAPTKSKAGERVLRLPTWAIDLLRRRASQGTPALEPVFADALGGFRDPSNVRRALRAARTPGGDATRQELATRIARLRRTAGLSRAVVADQLGWPKTRVELVETARTRIGDADLETLLGLYDASKATRGEIAALAAKAATVEEAGSLAWITSHAFRRTTATILDQAGLSARQIADQLGHARPSLTQDVYMGRGAKNTGAAAALDRLRDTTGH